MSGGGRGDAPATAPAITSVANARVKAAAGLSRRRARDDQRRYLVEGPRAVAEAVRDGVVETVFASAAGLDRLTGRWPAGDPRRDLGGAPAGAPELVTVADHVAERLSDAITTQGVVAVALQRRAVLDDVLAQMGVDGFLVVLDRVADPGNAGTIIRTADAAGASGVVFTTGSVDPWNPKAVRAAAGSTTHVALVVDMTLDAVLVAVRRAAVRVVALDAAAPVGIDDPGILRAPLALLFGSEAHGLDTDVAADVRAAIPVFGRAESLNLSAAAAVAAYAAARERRGRHEPAVGTGA